MKILLSAYACEPDKGSEPAVGWNWAVTLAKQGHEVFVLTRSNNRRSLDAEIARRALTLRPLYFDLPAWCRRWKHSPGGLYLYYLLWQIGAYRYARAIHSIESFAVVHHITFVTFRQPSLMGRLGIPFIFGPVGGGETSPPLLRKGLSLSARLREGVRAALIAAARYDPLMNQTFRQARLIACTTTETLNSIPPRFHPKCTVLPAIGIEDLPLPESSLHQALSDRLPSPAPHFLFIGRLLYWKGLHLILRAMPEVLRQIPGARLRVVGEGADADWLRSVAERSGVAAQVDWVPAMPHGEIARAYQDHLAFVFPSLHDSGGLVVLEALAAGLPVICLALGGPGVFVDPSCGIVIDAADRPSSEIERHLAAAMVSLAEQPEARQALARNCAPRARCFSWEHAAETLYERFGNISRNSSPSSDGGHASQAVAAGDGSAPFPTRPGRIRIHSQVR